MPRTVTTIEQRAAVHAALGDPIRLAIADELARSDRAPSELAERFGLATNLLAHHLDVLERVGLIERVRSSGDGRRRYVRLRPGRSRVVELPTAPPPERVLFVCTHNSARSQLAAVLWRARTAGGADSAGTHPADRVHPGAIAAARRAGLDLGAARPRHLEPADLRRGLVITVCDRAHEELDPGPDWLHWSLPDPLEIGTRRAFDETLIALDARIGTALAA